MVKTFGFHPDAESDGDKKAQLRFFEQKQAEFRDLATQETRKALLQIGMISKQLRRKINSIIVSAQVNQSRAGKYIDVSTQGNRNCRSALTICSCLQSLFGGNEKKTKIQPISDL